MQHSTRDLTMMAKSVLQLVRWAHGNNAVPPFVVKNPLNNVRGDKWGFHGETVHQSRFTDGIDEPGGALRHIMYKLAGLLADDEVVGAGFCEAVTDISNNLFPREQCKMKIG